MATEAMAADGANGSTGASCDVLVLGAGIVGLSTALQLQARGQDVILVDRQPPGTATSYGNAGIIQAEGIVPYMLPRDVMRVLRMALNQRSEAHVHWRALLVMAPWLVRYWLNSGQSGLEKGAEAHAPLIARAVAEHDELLQAAGQDDMLRRTGYLKVFRDTEDLETDERAHDDLKARYGIAFETLNPDRLSELEPHLSDDLVGALWFQDPASVPDPLALSRVYLELFRRNGGRVMTADARTLAQGKTADAGWHIQTVDGAIRAPKAVIALGPWSADLLKALGVSVPLAVKRGYHMHYKASGNASLGRPVIDADNGFVLAPMEAGIRLTTGAEFAFRDAPATPRQLEMVEPVARRLFPLDIRSDVEPWLGSRPCLPDMIPMIGPVPRLKGLYVNFGHQHLGLTLGPATGRLLAEMVTGEAPYTDPSPYRVDRF